MPSPTLTSIVSVKSLRRRLPLVGAFCVISLGLSNLNPPLSLSSKPCSAQSLPFSAFSRSKFSSQTAAKGILTVRMEAASSNKTVPSIVVYVTVPNKEAGKKLAESIVKEKLAACVNRVPGTCPCYCTHYDFCELCLKFDERYYDVGEGIESVYQWQGEIQTDSEELLIIKTRESLLEALTAHVKANHEYEVPEVIALPITGGNLQYLEWIKNSTKD
ncbi:hypothetical protein RJ639_031446 [Escallonia herrerae]|uniref:Protein CutA, chloroplastic n=1 Tax=Escallonia herrerae TaxID=1293975 RepID=A0AA88XA18_9ASTE|nr:hypothetical protein RJ639_031446 [Escallonia herrerae]